MTLDPSTHYWIYTNAITVDSGGNAFSGAQAYFASSSSSDFATINGVNTENFLLTGTPVPELATLSYRFCGMLVLSIIAFRIRRRA